MTTLDTLKEEAVEKKQIIKEIKLLHADLKKGGMYDGKVSDEFKAGWQDALQWLMTCLHPNQEITKDLEVESPQAQTTIKDRK